MFGQNSKKILFNKSTLLSLKAELLKKQEEVLEKKQLPQHRIENFIPPSAKTSNAEEKPEKQNKKSFKDGLKEIDTEELEACRKSKAALERKAELYEHFSDSAGTSQLASNFLVDFNSKKQQEAVQGPSPAPELFDGNRTMDKEEQSEWTEFTDCLGRTRKCLKSDLEYFLEKDRYLKKTTNKDNEDGHSNEEKLETDKPHLVQETNNYLQSLREKWEQKEKDLLAKDKDIHYQDLLYDEARMHGVSYFSFSTDETERQKQMDELMKSREATLRAQHETQELRRKRDELMKARVAAARARQRARAGLPPEQPTGNTKDFTTCLLEFLTQQRDEADSKAKAEEKKIREEKEREKQKLREAYIREWDLGKDGVGGTAKSFKEMTQDEYVEQQRAKRLDEFAPPQAPSSSTSNNYFDNRGNVVQTDTYAHVPAKTWSEVRPKINTPPPPDVDELTDQKGLYFSSSTKKTERILKYKNFVKAGIVTPLAATPIVDELNLAEPEDNLRKRRIDSNSEVAPPPTYDYYGPISKNYRPEKPFESDMQEAYEQGYSLINKQSNLQLPKHYDFTFD